MPAAAAATTIASKWPQLCYYCWSYWGWFMKWLKYLTEHVKNNVPWNRKAVVSELLGGDVEGAGKNCLLRVAVFGHVCVGAEIQLANAVDHRAYQVELKSPKIVMCLR